MSKIFYNIFSDREVQKVYSSLTAVQKVYSSLTPATTEIYLYGDWSLPLTPLLQVIWLHIESHLFWRLDSMSSIPNSQWNTEVTHEDHAFRCFGPSLNAATLKVFVFPNITYRLLPAWKKLDFFLVLNHGKSNGFWRSERSASESVLSRSAWLHSAKQICDTVNSSNCTAVVVVSSLPCLSMLQDWIIDGHCVLYKPTMPCYNCYVLICSLSRLFSGKNSKFTSVAATQSIFFN